MCMPVSQSVTKATKYLHTYHEWLKRQVHREDDIGHLARCVTAIPRLALPDDASEIQDRAYAEYEVDRTKQIATMTNPPPPELIELFRSVYANPNDRERHEQLCDWMSEHVGPTPVRLHESNRWANREMWKAVGANVDRVICEPRPGGSLPIDHWGKTMIHGIEAVVTEPYGTKEQAIGLAMSATRAADVIGFASVPGDWQNSTVRVGFVNPTGIVPREQRRELATPPHRRRHRGYNP